MVKLKYMSPYKSLAQERYFNIHKKELEGKGVNVNEWNNASKGRKLPEHVKKTKMKKKVAQPGDMIRKYQALKNKKNGKKNK